MKPGETGRMAIGIGLGQSVGTVGLLAPTYEIATNETITIDGLEIQIQLTPGTEAPAEMNAWFPKYKGLWLAENCTGTMHNIYTLRGAQVRDAAAWAGYILEAESLFGDEVEVVFQSHNWPHWGNETIRQYMEDTAAVYQYINNQTLYCINQGMTAAEISRTLTLPERLDKVWYCRQYYGTLSHNIKAVYQRYMGWYDANPVDLNPLMPEDTAKKWVEYLGDVDAVLEKARAEYNTLRGVVMHGGNNDIEDTSPTFRTVEDDGANQLTKEEASQLAQRQYKFIKNLEAALIRIENKTYGICRVTGKLIPKERLRLVPHATLTVEAKEMLAKQGKN
jgi:alkyl sulfatase BDS1-like metallo-beta-lactamase superfamily hydrolase